MNRSRGSRAIALTVLLLVTAALCAQPTGGPPLVDDAEPYDPAEFPGWALDLRRGEIIAFGSLPISLLASRLIYGFGRFVVRSIQAGAVAPEFLPQFLAPPGAIPLTRDENARIVVGAVSLSVAVAVFDYAIGRNESTDE